MRSKSDMYQEACTVGGPWPTQGSKDGEAVDASSSHTAAVQRGWRVVSGGAVVLWHNILCWAFLKLVVPVQPI